MSPIRRTLLLLMAAGLWAHSAAADITQNLVPTMSFLHTDYYDISTPPLAFSVYNYGMTGPGCTIRIESLGDWNDNAGAGDVRRNLVASFASNNSIDEGYLLHRFAAIDWGLDLVTGLTSPSGDPTDIDEDFAVDEGGVQLVVPTGATHLFVGLNDSYYWDNTDPDGDLRVRITVVRTTGVGDGAMADRKSFAEPNPFRSRSAIHFSLAMSSPARLTIHDLRGRWIRTLFEGDLTPGPHAMEWNGCDGLGAPMPQGVYFARIQRGRAVEAVRLVLVR